MCYTVLEIEDNIVIVFQAEQINVLHIWTTEVK